MDDKYKLVKLCPATNPIIVVKYTFRHNENHDEENRNRLQSLVHLPPEPPVGQNTKR